MSARLEDTRMVTGTGRFLSDFLGPDTLHAGFVRAEQASTRIAALDVIQAAAMPGVRAVFTAADLGRDGVAPIAHVDLPREDGGTTEPCPMPILCDTDIRHAGEPIALVIAETAAQLADAIEAAEVDLEPITPVSGTAFLRQFGTQGPARAAMAAAAHKHRIEVDIPRVTAFALEPRCVIARGVTDGGLHYRMSTQNPFALRAQLASHFGWDVSTIRVVADDVGGSFGMKGYMSREDAALAWAARKLQVEIAWIPTRSETILADAQGRGAAGSLQVGLDEDLKIVAIEGQFDIDIGAYPTHLAFGLMNNVNGLTGMYEVPEIFVEIAGQLSPRLPLVPFRGNGRPETTYAIERALDVAARKIGVDPIELRRRNLIGPDAMPVTTGLGFTIDCGDFPKVMQAALDLNPGAQERKRAAQARGMLYGVGLANCIESAGGPVRKPRPDFARLEVAGDGTVTLSPGVMSVGQGHETTLSEMVANRLQIDAARIIYRHGDTEALSNGRGSGGSAGLTVAGSAVCTALEELIAQGSRHAAASFGCSASEIAYRDGAFHREGTNENLPLAALASMTGGIDIESSFTPPAATFPNGAHICEVEIDPETGMTKITRYVAVEDVGRILNQVLVEGQLHGGIGQGLSLGLGEQIAFDEQHQILTGSLMDYRLARAEDLPMIETGSVEVPTALNPLGVKGVGEAGAVGATAALASAVSDALWRAGVEDFDLPATPLRIWEALQRR
ncbi:MAG: xanthine dehydrogenase family protein molybdopterin-binding subunit [Litoreibacter sp.]|nr:xanthine dehydrogenase family protein molybdopterin-binding subunit [Litoreibacter sp.]